MGDSLFLSQKLPEEVYLNSEGVKVNKELCIYIHGLWHVNIWNDENKIIYIIISNLLGKNISKTIKVIKSLKPLLSGASSTTALKRGTTSCIRRVIFENPAAWLAPLSHLSERWTFCAWRDLRYFYPVPICSSDSPGNVSETSLHCF